MFKNASRASNTPLDAPAPIVRHVKFYLRDEMKVFRVESYLFRVHYHFLAKNSPKFSSMLSGPDFQGLGDVDEYPIYLSGVTRLEFETLLEYLYSAHDNLSLSQSSWIARLSIAHRYEFTNVRARAIHEIYGPVGKWDQEKSGSGSDPGSKPPDYPMLILTAEKYHVPLEQALAAYVGLVMRVAPLTEVEITQLPALTVHRLSLAREEYLRGRYSSIQSEGYSSIQSGPFAGYSSIMELQSRAYYSSIQDHNNRRTEAERIVRNIWSATKKQGTDNNKNVAV